MQSNRAMTSHGTVRSAGLVCISSVSLVTLSGQALPRIQKKSLEVHIQEVTGASNSTAGTPGMVAATVRASALADRVLAALSASPGNATPVRDATMVCLGVGAATADRNRIALARFGALCALGANGFS